jgi:hypothetical protein
LRLREESPIRLTGSFLVSEPVEIAGEATGVVVEDVVRITVTYRSPGGCDGRIEGILTVIRNGAVLDGPVTVTDCSGPLSGHLSLSRPQGAEAPADSEVFEPRGQKTGPPAVTGWNEPFTLRRST